MSTKNINFRREIRKKSLLICSCAVVQADLSRSGGDVV